MTTDFLNAPRHEELPLDTIESYPDLAAALRIWRADVEGGGDGHLDPTAVPPRLLPTVMVIELTEDGTDGWVRLAGTFVCQIYRGELRGRAVSDFFKPEDAEIVMESLRRCVEGGEPSLARRAYVSLDGDRWEYVRILLPERARDGRKRLFKAMERSTLKRLPGPW
jgi:hypothetical protein